MNRYIFKDFSLIRTLRLKIKYTKLLKKCRKRIKTYWKWQTDKVINLREIK